MADINITVSGLPNKGKSVIVAEIVTHLRSLGVNVTFQDFEGEECIQGLLDSPDLRDLCLGKLIQRGAKIHTREQYIYRGQESIPISSADWHWVPVPSAENSMMYLNSGYVITHKKDGSRYRSSRPVDGLLRDDPFADLRRFA